MKILCEIILAAVACTLAGTAGAQDTNSLRTHIGLFEARTGVVMIKGFGPVGSIPLGVAQVSIGYKQTLDVSTGQKLYGLIIQAEDNQQGREAILIDEDEIAPLLQAADYLAKINSDVITLPGFEASYTTKAGLQIIAESLRGNGGVRNYLKFEDYPRIRLSPVQMTEFCSLIQEANRNLDTLKSGK